MNDMLVQVTTKLPATTIQKIEHYADKNRIVHKSSGRINTSKAVRRLVEIALDSQANSELATDVLA